jgi:hypothetical protein
MSTPSKTELKLQAKSLVASGLMSDLRSAASTYGVSLALVVAIASRETNCQNILGDMRGGEFHGVGLMQIDIQHDIARQARDSGSYKTAPAPLICFGVAMLADNQTKAARYLPDVGKAGWQKIAASGYNCGITSAIANAKAGDSDKGTTGHDYGADVMRRKAILEPILADMGVA